MKNYNTNSTTKALTVKKEKSLTIVQNVALTVIRVSSKALMATFALTFFNIFI